MYYVYILRRPWDMKPCYVGKGKGARVFDHKKFGDRHYNKHLAAIFRKAGGDLPHEIVFESDCEAAALAKEIELIAFHGRADSAGGPLCNLTDGGDGVSGWVPSPETREKIAAAKRGVPLSKETRAKMSAVRKGRPKSEEHKRKIGAARTGKKMPEAFLEKLRNPSAETREKKRNSALRFHNSLSEEEKRALGRKISEGMKKAAA